MQYAQAHEGPLQRFMKTKWFRVVLVLLLALASSVMLIGIGCYSLVAAPILVFALPYWLRERKVKNFLLNGIVVFIIALLLVTAIVTNLVLSSPKPDLSEVSGEFSLTHGTVDPYVGSTGEYRFSVVYAGNSSVGPADVSVRLILVDEISQNVQRLDMVGDTSGPPTQGWAFTRSLNLTQGFYSFGFNATTTFAWDEIRFSTQGVIGPLNAPWSTYYSVYLIGVSQWIFLAFFMYVIILGIYWWSQRMKQIRGPMLPPAKTETGGEFECTNCGADVSEEATRCPRCGAVFDEEPIVRAQKVEKEKNSESQADSEDKERKKKG